MVVTLILIALMVRGLEYSLFIKKVSKSCHKYDWKHVDANERLVLEIIKKDYHLTREWSAYNFVFLKGPNPIAMFFSLKPLTLENQYNNEVIKRLNKYETI